MPSLQNKEIGLGFENFMTLSDCNSYTMTKRKLSCREHVSFSHNQVEKDKTKCIGDQICSTERAQNL